MNKDNSKMSKENTLILITDFDFFKEKISQYHYHVDIIYKPVSLLKRIVRKLSLQKFKIFRSYWYGDWFYDLNKYENIILFNVLLDNKIITDIQKRKKFKRFIVWNWDPMIKTKNTEFLNENTDIELWSFDKEDCIHTGIKYNTQFYFNDIILNKNEEIYDLCFIGRDKGRESYIKEQCKVFESYNINYRFYIVKNNKQFIEYRKILDIYSKSKAILDITQQEQSGLSIRVLESLFFEKKLITNNLSVLSFDFYRKENIFLLGIDDINCLSNFLASEYKKIDTRILSYYSFDEWFCRF